MTKHLYHHANTLQRLIVAAGGPVKAPRVAIDGWATLWLWHRHGEAVWRISAEQAERLLDEPLPPDLPLATAPTRGRAVAYQLPERREWVVLARHEAKAAIPIYAGLEPIAYDRPTLTYITETDDGLDTGYYSLIDQPTPAALSLRPGYGLLLGRLTQVDISEVDYRVSLAIAQHFRP